MKYLCVCAGGNVRSVALAYVLKHELKGHEAIAIGGLTASKETVEMLCEWADFIVLMESHMTHFIQPKYNAKIKCVDVGPDVWGVHPCQSRVT
jgi:predicted protein tyrosine phosphatase